MNRLQDDNRKIELNTNKFNIIYPYFYFKKIGEYDRPIFYTLTVDYNLFRSGLDYQKKYLKYKQKYLNKKNTIKLFGGAQPKLTDDPIINYIIDFIYFYVLTLQCVDASLPLSVARLFLLTRRLHWKYTKIKRSSLTRSAHNLF
jgi:hypothetical protein